MPSRYTTLSTLLYGSLLCWLLTACGSSGSTARIVPGDNIQPTPAFNIVDTTADAPATVRFDASASTDPDGEIVNYFWDFDGDRDFDLTTDGPSASYEYTEAGTYNVTLTVEDDDGSFKSASNEMVVPGWTRFRYSDPDVYIENVAIAQINGKAALAWRESTNGSMVDSRIMYVPALDNSGTRWLQPRLVSTGNYAWGVADIGLVEANGKPAVAWYDKETHNLMYAQAADGFGSSWQAPVTVDSDTGSPDHLRLKIRMINGRPGIAYAHEGGDAYLHTLSYVSSADDDGHVWNRRSDLEKNYFFLNFRNYNQNFFDLLDVENHPAICWYRAGIGSVDVEYKRANDADGSNWPYQATRITSAGVLAGCHMGTLQPAGNTPRPVIMYLEESGSVNWTKSRDSVGSTWGLGRFVSPAFQGTRLAMQGGLLAGGGTLGLVFQTDYPFEDPAEPRNRFLYLDDETGISYWRYLGELQGPNTAKQIEMISDNGHPVVMMYTNYPSTEVEIHYYHY